MNATAWQHVHEDGTLWTHPSTGRCDKGVPMGIPKFTTKDSGAREEYASGMKRDTNDGKPRFDLVLPEGVPYKDQLFTRIAELMARGAQKYGDRNWEKATGEPELARAKESAFRHFMQWYLGETDEDHAAAVFFNIQEAEFVKYKQSHAVPDVTLETSRVDLSIPRNAKRRQRYKIACSAGTRCDLCYEDVPA